MMLMSVHAQQVGGFGVRCVQNPADLGIDQPCRVLAVRPPSADTWFSFRCSNLAIIRAAERHRTELVAHAPARHHLTSDAGCLLHVALGTGGASAIHDLLAGAAAHGADDASAQVALVVV